MGEKKRSSKVEFRSGRPVKLKDTNLNVTHLGYRDELEGDQQGADRSN
jgi:hypothetical protein